MTDEHDLISTFITLDLKVSCMKIKITSQNKKQYKKI